MAENTCLDCGRRLPPSFASSGNKRCFPCAKVWRASARCITCGADLSERRAAKFCSVRCADISYGTRRAAPLPLRICALPSCDVEFQPNRSNARCCSEEHGKALWRFNNPQQPEEWNDRRRDSYHRRRARKQSTESSDRPVLLADIVVRDKNRCHICRKKLGTKPWPDPRSASLDHLVPLSQGGHHVPENVRLAHLRCNCEKGNRGGNEQLLLIG